MSTVLWAVLGSVLMLAGFIGIFVPFIPGIPLAWGGLFIYAIGTDFERISITAVVVFFIFAVIITIIDFFAPMLGAKKYQASKFGILGAFLGLLVGIITSGFVGIIVGPFIGAYSFELIANKQPKDAFKSAFGTFIGFLAGSLIKIVFLLIMGGYFITSWF